MSGEKGAFSKGPSPLRSPFLHPPERVALIESPFAAFPVLSMGWRRYVWGIQRVQGIVNGWEVGMGRRVLGGVPWIVRHLREP